MPKSSNDGYQERTSAGTYLDLLTSYALAIQATWLACNRLQIATWRLASPRSQKPRFLVLCGRPISASSFRGGLSAKADGKSARLTLVR
jgi:hypothetical protein